MSTNDILHQILNLRRKCLAKTDEDNIELIHFHEQLIKWQQQIIHELEKFIEEKFQEIKKKYFQITHQLIEHLDNLYTNCLTNENNQQYYSQLFNDYNHLHLSYEIHPIKTIDFNQYIHINTNHLNDLQRSLTLKTNSNYLHLSSYQLYSTLSIHSNITSLFTTYDRLLIYYDHHTSTASLHILDLQNYLEQSNKTRSCVKLRVPCKQFQGKIMHMEYVSYLKGILLATGSKLFLLEISNTLTNYHVREYFDIIRGNFPGILQKFACHPTIPNLIYLLINTFSNYILIEMDFNKTSYIGKKWDYPIDDNERNNVLSITTTTTTNNNLTKFHSQLITIHDFVLGKNLLIFAITYQTNDNVSYQFHLRSFDMILQHRFLLNSKYIPLHICMLPCNYSSSWNEHEQFLIIYQKSKILSLYNINSQNSHDKIQLIDEMILDTEPEYIGFVNNNLSILLIRNLFHIAIYKQLNTI